MHRDYIPASYGPYGNNHDFALFFAGTFYLLFHKYFIQKSVKRFIVFTILIITTLIGIICTHTRGAFLAVIITFFLSLCVIKYRGKVKFKYSLIFIFLVSSAMLIFAFTARPHIKPSSITLSGDSFELWSEEGSDYLPYGWELISADGLVRREDIIIKTDAYSVKVIRRGTNCKIYHDFAREKGVGYWRGKEVTLSCWVYAKEPNRARIYIVDDVIGATVSPFHEGHSKWELLTATTIISNSAKKMGVCLQVEGGDTSAYFDQAILVDNSIPIDSGAAVLEQYPETS